MNRSAAQQLLTDLRLLLKHCRNFKAEDLDKALENKLMQYALWRYNKVNQISSISGFSRGIGNICLACLTHSAMPHYKNVAIKAI